MRGTPCPQGSASGHGGLIRLARFGIKRAQPVSVPSPTGNVGGHEAALSPENSAWAKRSWSNPRRRQRCHTVSLTGHDGGEPAAQGPEDLAGVS
jgi:hypothetical protein